MSGKSVDSRRVRVWDAPTRLAHWAIVSLFGFCWWSAKSDHMQWHRIAGYGLLGVVLFRLGWGFLGGSTARFANFVRSPIATWRYASKLFAHDRDRSSRPIGHNPLGGWSILAMLGLLLAQTVFGLFSVDVDGVASGPWAKWVRFDTGRRFAHLHDANFHLLLILIGLHLSAITFYRLARKESLVPAMIHGYKAGTSTEAPPSFVPWWRAALLAAAVCLAVVYLTQAKL